MKYENHDGVWMRDRKSLSRAIAEDVMDVLRIDLCDFRTRDKIILAICDRVDSAMSEVANSNPPHGD